MVLGTGVDIGVHLAAQCIDEPDGDVEKVVRHAGGSIMLASLTTLASFGTMIWSTSPGLVSVGAMSTLGTVGCLVATLVTLPAALILYVNRRRRTQAAPKAGAAE
jgi:predicted RND superfamily exporter protein